MISGKEIRIRISEKWLPDSKIGILIRVIRPLYRRKKTFAGRGFHRRESRKVCSRQTRTNLGKAVKSHFPSHPANSLEFGTQTKKVVLLRVQQTTSAVSVTLEPPPPTLLLNTAEGNCNWGIHAVHRLVPPPPFLNAFVFFRVSLAPLPPTQFTAAEEEKKQRRRKRKKNMMTTNVKSPVFDACRSAEHLFYDGRKPRQRARQQKMLIKTSTARIFDAVQFAVPPLKIQRRPSACSHRIESSDPDTARPRSANRHPPAQLPTHTDTHTDT